MATYEMFWDCGRCGAKKLLGKSHRHCPSCGAAQDAEARYFPAENEKVAVEDHAFYGADLDCDNCDSPNSAAVDFCVNCGARIGDGDSPVALIEDLPSEPVERGESFQGSRLDRMRLGAWNRKKALGLVAAALLVGILFLLVWQFWTRPVVLEATGHVWHRYVEVQQYRSVQRSGWCDGMPGDAYGVSRSRKQRSTKRIADGQTCSTVRTDNGDGTYSENQQCTTDYREEPVYDDHCSYTVDRWVHDHNVDTRGSGLTPAPHYASPSVSGCATLGCTRIGGRGGTYTVLYVEDADPPLEHRCKFGQDVWSGIPVGGVYSGKVRMIGGSLKCKRLEPVP
jgi:hypothetical protein